MTTPAPAINDEIAELIQIQIQTFGQRSQLTSSELAECHCRSERIRLLGLELDRIGKTAIRDKRFGRAS